MHVAMISSDCAPNTGGIAAHVLNLAVALRERGIQVTVLGGCQDARRWRRFQPPFEGFRVIHVGRRAKVSAALFAFWARRTLQGLLRRSPVDIVHVHNFIGDLVAVLGLTTGARRVATNHSSGFLDAYAAGRKRRIYPLLLGGYDAVIAPSRELEEKSTYLGVSRDRIHYVPNGVDINRFSPGDPGAEVWRRVAPFREEHRFVLSTRRLASKNGVQFLLRSIPQVLRACPDARFLLAGDGPAGRALEAEARAQGIRSSVRFLGHVPNERLLDLYRLAEACVLPSLQEATSISGLEAMACGKPIVGTRVGGIPEILEDGVTGVLVEPADPADLARGLLRVLSDGNLAARMGAKARERAREAFSWTAIAERTLSVYERCLGGSRA